MDKEKNISESPTRATRWRIQNESATEIIRKNYKGSDKLKGEIALIIGGDNGIGLSVAIHFAREGIYIAIVYLEENEDSKETKKLVEEEGRIA